MVCELDMTITHTDMHHTHINRDMHHIHTHKHRHASHTHKHASHTQRLSYLQVHVPSRVCGPDESGHHESPGEEETGLHPRAHPDRGALPGGPGAGAGGTKPKA